MKKHLNFSILAALALILFAAPAYALRLPLLQLDSARGAQPSAQATTTVQVGSSSISTGVSLRIGKKESAQDPEVHRSAPIASATNPQTSGVQAAPALAQPAAQAQQTSLGPNLIPNPSLETAGTGGVPANWHKGGYGTNTRTLTYPATPAHTGASAAKVAVSGYTSGDAKWYFDPVQVDGGSTYLFSDWYSSSVPTEVDLQVTHAGGSITYLVLGTPAASAAYTQFSAQFVMPSDATAVTVFHVVHQNGQLTVDDYALNKVSQTSSDNLVQNGDFETQGSGGLPAHWIKGGYGSNTRVFSYPTAGQSGNGASIVVSNYTSGDAKWASDEIAAPSGTYIYSDSYKASVSTILTAEFQRSDGTFFYADLNRNVPAASSWNTISVPFTMPTNAVNVRIFHLIKQNGSLSIDNASITASQSTQKGIFTTGAVSFRFDDGIENQYNTAAPILDNAGFNGTFYIISQQIKDNQFSGYMSIAQIQDLFARGEEIGAHTRTHPHLTTETAQQQQDEIAGSRQDILGWNVGPVLSFAYPYGEYNATTIQIVKNAGFTSGLSTIDGFVTPQSDHYQLEYQEVDNDITPADVQSWIDTAKQNHSWLILTFHDIKTGGDFYSTTPSIFQSIVNEVKASGLPVVTVSQGMQSM